MEHASADTRKFFAAFRSQMGCRQIVDHLNSTPRWWKLRSSRGTTALMHSLNTRGMTPELFSELLRNPEVEASVTAVDHGGKNLWWHLLYYRSYRNDTHNWIPLISPRVPLQASLTSGRGIFIDQIKPRLKRQWSNFFPTGEFARKTYALPGNTYDTWWQCGEEEAQAVAQWLLGRRQLRDCNDKSLLDNLRACESNQPGGMAGLPDPLQGALRLTKLLLSRRQEHLWPELAQERLICLDKHARVRTEERVRAFINPQSREYGLAFLREHDQQMLQATVVKATAQAPVRRL
jgi:hypothetical protein